MPVIVHKRDYDRWLDQEEDPTPVDILRPYEAEEMACGRAIRRSAMRGTTAGDARQWVIHDARPKTKRGRPRAAALRRNKRVWYICAMNWKALAALVLLPVLAQWPSAAVGRPAATPQPVHRQHGLLPPTQLRRIRAVRLAEPIAKQARATISHPTSPLLLRLPRPHPGPCWIKLNGPPSWCW